MTDKCAYLFTPHTLEEHTDSMVAYLPGGTLFDAKNEKSSVLRRLFEGLAVSVKALEDTQNAISHEHDINCTDSLISAWEAAVGIPDSCFDNTGTLEERRKNVLIKLGSLGVSTAKGFIDLAAMFGYKCLIPSGASYAVFPLRFPATFSPYPQQARFTLRVILDTSNTPEVFPFTVTKFPIPFFSSVTNVIECLFRMLAPANCEVIFNYQQLS